MPAHNTAGRLRNASQPPSNTQSRTRVVTTLSLFRAISREMVDELVTRLTAAGYGDVPAAQHPVLENLDPDGTRLTTLGARAGITHQSMGELVAALERNGYVERRPDPADRRARLVCLTRKGRALVRQAVREISEIETIWLTRFADAGLTGDLRAVLKAAIERSDPSPPAPIPDRHS
jgi:DNA-binding MarR family transcriptional regulator